jgi:hypothetical protein
VLHMTNAFKPLIEPREMPGYRLRFELAPMILAACFSTSASAVMTNAA